MKVRHKAITTLQLGPGAEYNYAVVKKGLLYVEVKQGYEFVCREEDGNDVELIIVSRGVIK